MKHTKSGRKLTEIITETFRLNGSILNTGNLLVKSLELTSARWQVLSTLKETPLTVSEIARRMGLSRQNVQRIANRLIEDGLAETIDNPAHSKAKLYRPTAVGKETMEEITKRQIKWANEISKDMDVEKLTTTIETMNTITQMLNKYCEENR